MSRIIAVANQKGGVGKTTTAINLSACLAEKNKKVLTLDMDPQGNTTSGLGVDKNQTENTVYELILDESELSECIYPSVMENLSVIPSNINLSGAEIELIGFENKEYLLKSKLDMIRSDYDYIIIDCPPSLNLLTINAMAAADSVIVPIQCEYYALEGLSQLIHTIDLIKERLNPKLEIEGVVKYDAFKELGGQLSFAYALLNDSNTGFVMNCIHSREGSYTYIKDIVRGECELPLSEEEAEAVKNAIASNSPQPTTTTIAGGKKIRKITKSKAQSEETPSKKEAVAKKKSASQSTTKENE